MSNRSQLPLFTLGVSLLLFSCGLADGIQDQEGLQVEQSQNVQLHIVGGDQQSALIGEILEQPLVVNVADSSGRPLEKRTVSFEILEGDGLIMGTDTPATTAEGNASVQVQAGSTASTIHVQARVSVPKFDEKKHLVDFFASVLPAAKPKLVIGSDQANAQHGTVGTNLPVPLSVIARGLKGEPLPGQSIEFKVWNGSPDVRITSQATTDTNGTASTIVSLGKKAESIEIVATWLPNPDSDPDRVVTFHATADAGPPTLIFFSAGLVNGGRRTCAPENTQFPLTLKVGLTDSFGNGIGNYPITIDPDGASKLLNSALGVEKIFVSEPDGSLQFSLFAGSVPAGIYNAATTVCASAAVPNQPTLQTCGTLDFTKASYIELTNGTQVYNYGITSTNTYTSTLTVPIYVNSMKHCWQTLPNAPITLGFTSVNNSCPAAVPTWPAEGWAGDYMTDTLGRFGFSQTFTVMKYAPNPNAGPVANRLSITSTFTNTVYVYAGPTMCQ